MQVVVTVAGQGSRFQQQGYNDPKPLVSVMGKPAIHYLMGGFSADWKLIFVLGDHLKNSDLENSIKEKRPESVVIYVPHSDRGPIDTVLAALPFLDANDSVAVSYCDYAMIWNPDKFENFVKNSKCNLSVVSYRGFHPTYLGPNTYAHLKIDQDTNHILKIKEKSLFGNHIEDEWTSVGFYYFRTVELLKRGLDLQIQHQLKYGSEFYISLAVQALMQFENVSALNYSISHFIQMGTPDDVQLIEKWYQFIQIENKKNAFEANSVDEKLFNYFKYVFKKIPAYF